MSGWLGASKVEVETVTYRMQEERVSALRVGAAGSDGSTSRVPYYEYMIVHLIVCVFPTPYYSARLSRFSVRRCAQELAGA